MCATDDVIFSRVLIKKCYICLFIEIKIYCLFWVFVAFHVLWNRYWFFDGVLIPEPSLFQFFKYLNPTSMLKAKTIQESLKLSIHKLIQDGIQHTYYMLERLWTTKSSHYVCCWAKNPHTHSIKFGSCGKYHGFETVWRKNKANKFRSRINQIRYSGCSYSEFLFDQTTEGFWCPNTKGPTETICGNTFLITNKWLSNLRCWNKNHLHMLPY